ncbi:MAG: hypothetical protein ABJP45_12820 [Cyclobacteriaceae bacterium]
MKKLLFIAIAILLMELQVEAQLLEDNQSRLKTTKVKSSGFLFFRNKNKGKTGPGANRQKVTGQTTPRFSVGRASFKTKGIAPRYSSGSPFRSRDYRITPRYSSGNPFRGSQYRVTPRYSAGNPFRGSAFKVSPRYTAGNPFRGSKFKASPRYSQGNPFRGSKFKASPRYSSGNPFRGSQFKANPRYSQGMPFRGKDYKVSPRYSTSNPFRGMSFKVSPRYSQGMPFQPFDFKVKPRVSTGKNRFIIHKGYHEQHRYYNVTADYRGNMKVSRRGPGDQHPSSNYHFAMRFNSPQVRKMFRKWNIFWGRVHGNKEEPKGIKASVRSPKFDKKEKDIWNN